MWQNYWNILSVCILCLLISVAKSTNPKKERRIYTFAFSNDGYPANFIENGKLVGQSVDLVKAVCRFAGKKCKTAVVQRSQCWDNSQGFPPYSMALNNGWYGCCANLPPNPERRLSYSFGTEDYLRTPEPTLIKKKGSKIKMEDLQDCNDFSLAFAANTAVEPDCLLDAGFFVKTQKLIPVTTVGVFDLPTIMGKIAELVTNGTVDLGLTIPRFLSDNNGFERLLDIPCANEVPLGLNNMMKHDDFEFIEWWSAAVHEYMCHPKYLRFCEKLEDDYGIDPLCRRPGYDLDCSSFGGKPKSKKPVEPHRINPCVGPKCPNKKRLVFGQSYFSLKDNLGRDVTKSLLNSGDIYIGEPEKDVRFIIQLGGNKKFTVDRLCVTVKDVKALKFIFRGGLRNANEVNVPVTSETKWTEKCVVHDIPRKLVVIKFRVAERKNPDPTVKIKDASMSSCLQ